MADTRARIRIEGEDATGPAWRSALGNANKASRGIATSMKSAFGGIGLLSGAGLAAGIGATVRNSIQLADQLGVLSEKTGVAVSNLSALKYTSEQLDVEFSSLEDGLVKLQRTMGEANDGNKEAARAFAQLGISLNSIRDKKADQVFSLIADKIRGLGSESDRTKALVDLFGRSGADLLPIMLKGADGIQQMTDRAKDLGIALNDADVDQLREFGDRIQELNSRWDVFTTNLLGKVAPGLSRVLEYSTKKTDSWIERITTGSSIITRLIPLLAQFNQGLDDAAMPRPARGTINRGSLAGGLSPEELAAQWKKIYAERSKAQRAFASEMEDAQRLTRTSEEQYLVDLQEFLKARDLLLANNRISPEVASARTIEFIDKNLPKAELIDKGAFAENVKEMADTFGNGAERMQVYADQAARNMQDAFADFLFDPFKGGLKGMLKGFVDVLRKMAAEAAAAAIFKSLFGGESKDKKGGGFFGTLFGSIFGGGKAIGGPVNGGMSYLVGERGPEMLTLGRGQSGVITPNDKLAGRSGGNTYNIVQNFSGVGLTQEQTGAMIARANADLVRRLSDAEVRNGRRPMR